MHKIEARYSKPTKNTKFTKTQIDCVIVPHSELEKTLKTRPWLDASTQAQVDKKLKAKNEGDKEAKKKDKSEPHDPLKTPSFDSLSVYFSEGGESLILGLPKEDFSTYELQTALRKTFGGFFGEGAKHDIRVECIKLGRKHGELVEKIVEGFGHLTESADWKPQGFGKKAEPKTAFKDIKIEFVSDIHRSKLEKAFTQGRVKARACNYVRTLTALPPNELNPRGYRKHIENFSKKHGISYEFFDRKALEKKGANAFLAVVRADPNTESGIAKLTYKPKKGSKKKIALVGKGLCFDTGGYNVKTGDGMVGMHGDMMGSAVALAALEAFKELNLPYEVTSYLAIAENLISPTGYKPNEVVIAMNGLSIEIVDTDAEGRMVLSDTLTMASEAKPDLILDYATLTGSVIRCLDRRRSGVYSNRENLLPLANAAGEDCGERVWGFPIGRDYLEVLKSEHADIMQCNAAWNADHIYASTFLSRFVMNQVPWVHVDLAASESKGGLGLVGTDTTGFGVAWTLAFVDKFFKK